MTDTKLLIKTLTIQQLLSTPKWSNYSINNILELANQGYFGLYVQPKRKKRTWYDVNKNVNKLVQAKSINNEEREYYQELNEKLSLFQGKNPYLLAIKPGYERLATPVETEICGLCSTSAIQRLLENGKIPFFEFNNTFGFFEENGTIFANSYFLHSSPNFLNLLPENYRGFYSIDDVFVFIDQIYQFEQQNTAQFFSTLAESVEKENIVSEECRFVRQKSFYEVTYKQKTIRINATQGMKYIEYLIKNANKKIPSLLLAQQFSKHKQECVVTHDANTEELKKQGVCSDAFYSNDTLIKNSTKKNYQARIEKIQTELLPDAIEFHDTDEIEKLKDELDSLNKEIRISTKKGGKLRVFSNQQDIARRAISKAIIRALNGIKLEHLDLYNHLEAHLHRGGICRYQPIEKITWE